MEASRSSEDVFLPIWLYVSREEYFSTKFQLPGITNSEEDEIQTNKYLASL